ncbi:MAG TPA: LysM peptidoglycan-binding domain-containing protein, partial [Anaerolineae bacterium]|nr:LysM peptidoglycan-binding domain-containing protein [Anaerolineae bacterium]
NTTKQGKPFIYTVRRGDTLYGIARRFGVTLYALVRANGLSSTSVIYPGQKLWIPAPTTVPQPRSPTRPRPGCPDPYIVRRGDSWSKIATRCGVTVAQLKSWNSRWSNLLHPGDAVRTSPPTRVIQPTPTPTPTLRSKVPDTWPSD